MSVKKAIDLEGFLKRNSQILESSDPTFKISKRGIGGNSLPEPVPEFVEASVRRYTKVRTIRILY